MKQTRIGILGVPFGLGAGERGAEFGSQALRHNGLLKQFKQPLTDYGELDLGYPETMLAHPGINYFPFVKNCNEKVAAAVATIMKNNEFPLIIGGDHSIALGSISAITKEQEIAVIWADAHGDINPYTHSGSGNSHGMPLHFLLGHGDSSLKNIGYEGAKLKEENIFLIGQRDLDPPEVEFIEKSQVQLHEWETISDLTLTVANILAAIREKGIKHLHLSFDIDFMDALVAPGTGTPVKDGPSLEQTKQFLKQIAASGLLKSMDFVEYNPLLDEDEKTAAVCLTLIKEMFEVLE